MKYNLSTYQLTRIKAIRTSMRQDSIIVKSKVNVGASVNDPFKEPASVTVTDTPLIVSIATDANMMRRLGFGGEELSGKMVVVASLDDRNTLEGEKSRIIYDSSKWNVIRGQVVTDTNEYLALCEKIGPAGV